VSVTVRELAELVHGTVHGDGHCAVHAARPIGEAQAGDITFLESDKHAAQLVASAAAAAVVAAPMPLGNKALIEVADPLMAFVAIVRRLSGKLDRPPHGIDPLASIHPSAEIGDLPSIQPFVRVGAGAIVGKRC
jgi:UDP-3-O-[3-hydroxymyristoyl] glucosamine N-acyltransferase